ncbi:radical S-adenosyl methionine domain-containing protein 1 [Geranomyces variabilis]|uniref:Radical S-adenosyl methionine domain-containing protein 1 n=1 Tax=Geranomyces variabilis TaxID=109894 RepID=A0AAD5TQI4_9FUNG|nr:radical S-adenosyl methionine domain-containing protein 1 [Geranomyces variabilis]
MEAAQLAELTHSLTRSPLTNEPVTAGRRTVTSVYFGGGTPSLARPTMVSKILNLLPTLCNVPADIEVSLEGNPTSIETARLHEFRNAGVNRLSLGLQALDERDLKFFGRDHSAQDGRRAVEVAREVFDRVSVDAIWGRPGQTVEAWTRELEEIATFGVSHLSLYQLTVERGTPLFRALTQKTTTVPDADFSADMYEATVSTAARLGYMQYEVSSFALHGERRNRSAHNSSYWTGSDYIGIGPGAHGRVRDGPRGRVRTYRVLEPRAWMAQCERDGHGMRRVVVVSDEETAREVVLLGLRTTDGLDFDILRTVSRAECPVEKTLDVARVEELIAAGLLEWTSSQGNGAADRFEDAVGLRATTKGLAVVDRVVSEILA